MNSLLLPILMIMSGILIGVILRSAQKYIKIPYTVALFAIGLAAGFIFKYDFFGARDFLAPGVKLVSDMNPDFILYVFLPILVFDAAYEMDLHVFKKTLVNSSILAAPGVVICMLLTAGMLMLLADILGFYDNSYWKYALMFGGLISATDPIAVVALLKDLGTNKRFSTLVDGEALLNDGTGIVCFMLFYSEFAGGGVIDKPGAFFLWVCLVSCVIGYAMVKLALLITTRLCAQEAVQNCVMIACAYITFILAQSVLEVSGVIALVVFGHLYAQSGKTHLKPEVNEFMAKFWGLLTEIANTLIFLIVGIIIATKVDLQWLRNIPWMQDAPGFTVYLVAIAGIVVVYVGLNVIRYIMIAVLYPAIKHIGYGLTFKESIILGWSGLRGAVAMTLALMVSCNDAIPESVRGIILLLTAGTITLTLCINATTSKALVKKLGLDRQEGPLDAQVKASTIGNIRLSDEERMKAIKAGEAFSAADWDAVTAKLIAAPQVISEVDLSKIPEEEITGMVRKAILNMERVKVENDFQKGITDHRTYMEIVAAISIHEDYNGEKPLDEFELDWLKKKSVRRFNRINRKKLRRVLEGCCGMMLMLEAGKEFLTNFKSLITVNPELKKKVTDIVGAETDRTVEVIKDIFDTAKGEDPELYRAFITDKAAKMMLSGEREQVKEYAANGLVVEDFAAELLADIDSRQGIEIYD